VPFGRFSRWALLCRPGELLGIIRRLSRFPASPGYTSDFFAGVFCVVDGSFLGGVIFAVREDTGEEGTEEEV